MLNKMERLSFKTHNEIISNSLKNSWYKYCSLKDKQKLQGEMLLRYDQSLLPQKVPNLNMLVSKM
jgi:hypothetical protein